jgi:hypothetical protein
VKKWPKKFGSADADDWNSGKSRRKYPGRQKKRRGVELVLQFPTACPRGTGAWKLPVKLLAQPTLISKLAALAASHIAACPLFFFLEKNELQGVEALTAQRHVQAEQNNQVQQKQTHSKPQNL